MENKRRSDLILLCGGNSSRMGQPKGLVSFDGKPWLTRQLERVGSAGVGRAVIVLGHHSEAYLAAKPWTLAVGAPQIELVINPAPERGQFSSLLCGAQKISGDAFVLPIDVPCADAGVWRAVEEALRADVKAALPQHEKRGGHPICLSSRFLAHLRAVSPDLPEARLDVQLHRLPPAQVARVNVDDARVLMNLNTPDDWRHAARES